MSPTAEDPRVALYFTVVKDTTYQCDDSSVFTVHVVVEPWEADGLGQFESLGAASVMNAALHEETNHSCEMKQNMWKVEFGVNLTNFHF